MITLKSKYKIKNNYKDIKLFILLISLLIIKILLIFFIGEDGNALLSESENEWGKLFISLKNHGYMSWFSTNEILFRNAFMPPLYVYFIYIISFISEVHLVKITLIIQIFLSLLTSFIFFKLCIKKRFSNNQAITACIIFSYYPLHLYGTTQISSATIVLFIYTLFIYLIVANKNIFFISLVASAGILARGEFKFIYIIFIFYYILKNKVSIKKAFLSFLLTIAIIFPQLLNNYIYFEKIFITHSSGYVLWRGNNELSNVTSIDADKIIGNMEKSMLRSNKTNNDEIQKMMEELNEHINASELKPWIINDDIEEDINPFFDGALSLYKECTIKDLLKICNYYGIEKNMKLLKSKKQQIIHALIYFESLPENFEIVQKRYRMWSCITELLNDSKMKKYIIF